MSHPGRMGPGTCRMIQMFFESGWTALVRSETQNHGPPTESSKETTKKILFKSLNRRSQRRSITWTQFRERLKHWNLPWPRVVEKPVQATLPSGCKTA